MNIARWSVSKPVAVTMRIAALCLLGLICLLRLPIDLLPRVDIPTIAVNTSWPNTAPEEMEAQITRPIEQAVSTVNGLYSVSSTSQLGQSSVRVQLNYGTNIDAAAADVQQFVNRARGQFPTDPTLEAPTVTKFDPSTLPIIVYGVSGESDPVKLRQLLDEEITPLIESADGVAQVVITGGQERAIIVDTDPAKLQAYNLALTDVTRRIGAENVSLPAGIAAQGGTESTIRSTGYFTSLKDAENLPLGVYGGRIVLLRDVAVVRDAGQEQRIFTRINGEKAVGISISKQAESNTVETTNNVLAKIKEIEGRYPNLKFTAAYSQAGFIEGSIHELQETAIIGGVLAILVITFFLRNVRSTLVVALSIPISITSTFALLYFGGFTLNTISLSGLALATGLIVDDAIVVLENIFRHIERDKKRAPEAAVTGTQEILGAVVASTITVMVVFLPLLLVQGQSGQTFTQFALVVIFSIAISLIDAVSVVPMLASRFIKEKEIETLEHPEEREGKAGPLTRLFDRFGGWFNAMDASYHRGLQFALKRRWLVLGGALLTIVAVVPLVPLVGSETLPQTDSGDFQVRIKLPIGTALETTNRTMDQVEKILRADKDVETVFLASGANLSNRGTTSTAISYQGSATVRLKADRKTRTEDVVKRLQGQMRKLPGVQASLNPYDLVANILGGQNQGMEVDVFGQDLTEILAKAKEVRQAMSGIAGLEAVDLAIDEASPELQWKIDRDKAAALGVSYQDVASLVGAATNGQLTTYYQERGYQYPIYVQVPVDRRRSVEDILQLPLRPSLATASSSGTANGSGSTGGNGGQNNGNGGTNNATGGTGEGGLASRQILLGQVVTPVQGTGPNQITRLNRQRYIAVSGRVADRAASDVQTDVQAAMGKIDFPTGTFWDFGDQQKRKAEEFSGLGLAVFLAIALIYMLLASQFESFIDPLIVLCSVPLCATGVVLALFLTGRAFGLTAFVGLLMLIGIVVKNGILLVDYTNHLRAEGMPRDEAIYRAGPTRLRPILMTSACAILGMLPLALGIGASSELQAPLATAVVGGLMTSTLLTLFIVPVVYTLFDDLARKLRKDDRDLSRAKGVEPTVGAVSGAGAPIEEPVLPGTVA